MSLRKASSIDGSLLIDAKYRAVDASLVAGGAGAAALAPGEAGWAGGAGRVAGPDAVGLAAAAVGTGDACGAGGAGGAGGGVVSLSAAMFCNSSRDCSMRGKSAVVGPITVPGVNV